MWSELSGSCFAYINSSQYFFSSEYLTMFTNHENVMFIRPWEKVNLIYGLQRYVLNINGSEQPILVSVSVSVRFSALGLVLVSVSVDPTDTDTSFTSKYMTIRSSTVEKVETNIVLVEAKKKPFLGAIVLKIYSMRCFGPYVINFTSEFSIKVSLNIQNAIFCPRYRYRYWMSPKISVGIGSPWYRSITTQNQLCIII